jgi:hypothetical protein
MSNVLYREWKPNVLTKLIEDRFGELLDLGVQEDIKRRERAAVATIRKAMAKLDGGMPDDDTSEEDEDDDGEEDESEEW